MIDIDSETWRDVATYLDAAIQTGMRVLMSPQADYSETMFLRGQLQALNALREFPTTQQARPEPVPILKPGEIY